MVAADHLQVPRQHGLFHHHGIDLGDGTVAHYLEGREILRSSLEQFCKGKIFSVVEHPKASSKRLTLSRAISRIGEQNYNLLFNNCEHFANWCKTGFHRSLQMESLIRAGTNGAYAIGDIMPGSFIKGLSLIIQKGLKDKATNQAARENLANLERLRLKIFKKLTELLKQAELSLQSSPENSEDNYQKSLTRALMVKGQTLADQLTAIEDLEIKITNLLQQSEKKN